MVMTSTTTSVEAHLLTFIVKNLLSKDAIVTFVTDTELYFTKIFILNGIFFRVKVPFNCDMMWYHNKNINDKNLKQSKTAEKSKAIELSQNPRNQFGWWRKSVV